MKKIIEGIVKFQNEVFPVQKSLFRELAGQQQPQALFLTCSDSRIVPNLVTQTDPGDLFIIRNAGNIAPPYGVFGGVSATIEYAVMVLNVKAIIVCGHSDCGAMKACLTPEKLTAFPSVSRWLQYADVARQVVEQTEPHLEGKAKIDAIVEQNVVAQLANLRTQPCVAARERAGSLSLHGWVYDIASGEVKAYDEGRRRFVPVAETIEAVPEMARA